MIAEAIQAQRRIIPPQLLPLIQVLAQQMVAIYRPAPVREVPAPVRNIPAQDEDILQTIRMNNRFMVLYFILIVNWSDFNRSSL